VPAAGGFAWFDDHDHDLTAGFDVVDAAIADAAAPGTTTILFGTSQGAAMALACALRPAPRPHIDAVIGLAGFLPDPEALRLDDAPAADRPAVFLWAAEDDEVVPPLRVRAAARVLARHGLEVEVAEGRGGHEVSGAALAAAREWLTTRPAHR
jgi:predicted esterase